MGKYCFRRVSPLSIQCRKSLSVLLGLGWGEQSKFLFVSQPQVTKASRGIVWGCFLSLPRLWKTSSLRLNRKRTKIRFSFFNWMETDPEPSELDLHLNWRQNCKSSQAPGACLCEDLRGDRRSGTTTLVTCLLSHLCAGHSLTAANPFICPSRWAT